MSVLLPGCRGGGRSLHVSCVNKAPAFLPEAPSGLSPQPLPQALTLIDCVGHKVVKYVSGCGLKGVKVCASMGVRPERPLANTSP